MRLWVAALLVGGAGVGLWAVTRAVGANAGPLLGGGAISTLDLSPAAPSPITGGAGVHAVSAAGAQAIKLNEAPGGVPKLTAYPDAAGFSIGYGHFGATAGETITAAQAEDLFDEDLETAEEAVNAHVSVALDQGQFDALTDFVFNVGVGNFSSSTLLKDLNAGNYAAAAQEFQKWKFSGGQVVAALVDRRAEETQEFDA